MQFWVRTEMHCTQIIWKLYKMWMSVFTQFRVRIGIHGTKIVSETVMLKDANNANDANHSH